jgi:hypothetical protein
MTITPHENRNAQTRNRQQNSNQENVNQWEKKTTTNTRTNREMQ